MVKSQGSNHRKMADEFKEKLIGRRFVCEGYTGTLKYFGEVPPTTGDWFGVEWDDENRGKHNGTHEGIKYFECSCPCSGSFVRPKKVSLGVSATTALWQRYSDSIQEEDMFVHGKGKQKTLVEMVGAEKVQQKQSCLALLKEVSLRKLSVSGSDVEEKLSSVAPSIKELDLSKNLLSSWNDVADVTENLSKLETLNLSENLLRPLESMNNCLSSSFSTVCVLYLNKMHLTWLQVELIVGMMPALQDLHACHNNIQNLRCEQDDFQQRFSNIRLLNLEGNKLCDWKEVERLRDLPRLETLILNDNGFKDVRFTSSDSISGMFCSLKVLYLSQTQINDTKSIDELNKLSSLDELRFSKNPVFQGYTSYESRLELLARIASIKNLNGSTVTEKEREIAERTYLKKNGKEWIDAGGKSEEPSKRSILDAFLDRHPRFKALVAAHGLPLELEQTQPRTLKDSLIAITIKCPEDPSKKTLTKKLPVTMTIGKLKGLLNRLLKVASSSQKLSYYDNKLEREIDLDDDLRQLSFYSIHSGDTVLVRWL